MFKRAVISFAGLVGIAALAVASTGGGNKSKSSSFYTDFKPIRVNQTSFTLKSAPEYSGSLVSSSMRKNDGSTLYNTMVTYQRGNTIYLVPINYQVKPGTANNGFKSNLEVLDIKFRLNKNK